MKLRLKPLCVPYHPEGDKGTDMYGHFYITMWLGYAVNIHEYRSFTRKIG